MSIARPTALIRRAAALPIGLLDRAEASVDAWLDAGFARVDGALDRRINAVVDRTTSLSQGITRSADSLDRALDQQVANSDSRSARRIAKTKATTFRLGSLAVNFEARADAKLNCNLHSFDRATDTGTQIAASIVKASINLTHRADNKIARGFDCADARATNIANRTYSRRVKTLNLAHRVAFKLDQRIETDFLRADARVNAGINHSSNAIKVAVVSAIAATNATDMGLSNAISRFDSRVDRRIAKGTALATATANLVSEKALSFERALDKGMSRVDTRIENGKARIVTTTVALANGAESADQTLSRALARVDSRVDSRIAQVTYAYVKTATIAANRVAASDSKLDATVAGFDARVATGTAAFMAAAKGVSNFVVDRAEDADTALTNRMSRIDARAEALIDLMNGQPGRHANQPRTSLPWAATSLTLVLGTLGAATGASVVNASTVQTDLDVTVQVEAIAAKDAVSQYLSVRDSFAELQASRSRTIQTLEQDIAAAQQRASQTFIDGDRVIDIANDYGGVPYVRGGTTPKGFDCSGYTSYVFAQMGISLPRVAAAQYNWADKISASDRKPGDLMFWSNGGGVHHVAIYAGDGKMWDSPRPGRRVGKISIWGSPMYGRVPIEALNAPALREIESKTKELEKLQANPPQLPITIDDELLLPLTESKLQNPAQKIVP